MRSLGTGRPDASLGTGRPDASLGTGRPKRHEWSA